MLLPTDYLWLLQDKMCLCLHFVEYHTIIMSWIPISSDFTPCIPNGNHCSSQLGLSWYAWNKQCSSINYVAHKDLINFIYIEIAKTFIDMKWSLLKQCPIVLCKFPRRKALIWGMLGVSTLCTCWKWTNAYMGTAQKCGSRCRVRCHLGLTLTAKQHETGWKEKRAIKKGRKEGLKKRQPTFSFRSDCLGPSSMGSDGQSSMLPQLGAQRAQYIPWAQLNLHNDFLPRDEKATHGHTQVAWNSHS